MKQKEEKELVGVKEIARRANVSIATVDRVLHNRTGVALKTKKKIEEIIKELDYKPNILARRLASKEILKFAVLIPAVSAETDYWDAPLEGINRAEQEVSSYGIEIDKYFFDQNDKASFIASSSQILKNNYHGVLLAPMFIEESTHFVNDCAKLKIPCVFINSDLPDISSLCYIGPDLYHSGVLAAHLCGYLIEPEEQILLVNISKEINNYHHLLRKEQGFKEYFDKKSKANNIIKLDIRNTNYNAVSDEISKVLATNKITLVFVTNSRVASVAKFFNENKIEGVKLIGFDYLKENIEYLKSGVIDFLICQKPIEQGYRGIMALYQHFVLKADVDKVYHMPIDIITKENFQFYRN